MQTEEAAAGPGGLTVAEESPHSSAARLLMAQLSAELGARYGDDGSGNFDPADAAAPAGAFLLARLGGTPVGCGALRPLKEGVAEIKRMYVAPAARGQGIGRRLLGALEAKARGLGYGRVWLETGVRQPEAVALYESAGYGRMGCYGQYVDNPLSVCFEKRLK